MDAPSSCSQCALPTPRAAPEGLCPRCLLEAALDPGLPRAFGPYELRARIGAGGMGAIFEAWDARANRCVALKVVRAGSLASERERERFRREALAASQLHHANIVKIFDVGEVDGTPYFTMPLIRGGTLESHAVRLQAAPREAARLMARVARAVHHGHLRGVLHRDLKPANILVDDDGQPLVADFGIAKLLDDADTTLTLGMQGSPDYVSPEQAAGAGLAVTTRSDVYSLGVMLYELACGRLPFEGASVGEVLERRRLTDPPRPRSVEPRVDRDLETIIQSCLERSPERRLSAEELAENLESYAQGLPISLRPLGAGERAWRWAAARPVAAHLALSAVVAALSLGVAGLALARSHERERRQDLARANAFAARALAGQVLFQLAEFGELVKEVAADPKALARLSGPKCGEVWPELGELGKREGFVSLGLWDLEGGRVARWPYYGEAMHCDRRFAWTSYFRGAEARAKAGRREAYVARTSTSEVTGQDKFTISAPIFDAAGAWRGVFYVSVGADSVLKRVALYPDDDRRHTAALLGRRDVTRETQNDPLPENFVVVIHQGLEAGHTLPVTSLENGLLTPPSIDVDQWELNPQRPAIIEDYVDPVPGFEGRWLAAVAPVGFTNFAVVVQTRVEAILEPDARLAKRLLLWAGAPFALLALAFNLGLWALRRRRA